MSSRIWMRLGMLATFILLLQGAAECPSFPEMEEVEVTVVVDEFIELNFEARGGINVHSDTHVIDVEELRDQIEEAGFEIDAIDSAHVSAVLYGVTAYYETLTDREIQDAVVIVIREDTQESETLIDEFDAAVYPLLGELVSAPIEEGGIDFVNELLADLLAALQNHSVSTFEVSGSVSGISVPQERETSFDWRLRIYFQVVGRVVVERPAL